MAALLPLLLQKIIDVGSKWLERNLPPERMSEKERLQLEGGFLKDLLAMDWTAIEKEYEDRASARLLAQAELVGGNALTKSLAALHRPLWSLVMLALFIGTVVIRLQGHAELDLTAFQWGVFDTVLKFYFGGRTIEKAIDIYSRYRNGRK